MRLRADTAVQLRLKSIYSAQDCFSLSRIPAINYISSERHDGTVSCIKKIVYRQNTGGTATRTILLSWSCARLAESVVCGYWLSEARVFLCKTNRKCRNTCYLRDTLFRDTPCVTPEYGKRTTATRSLGCTFSGKINRSSARRTRPCVRCGFNFNLDGVLKRSWKVRETNDCVDICQEINIYPIANLS